LSKWHVFSISGIGKGFKLQVSENIEGDVELSQNTTLRILVVKGRMEVSQDQWMVFNRNFQAMLN
jgi:hypothetical protein